MRGWMGYNRESLCYVSAQNNSIEGIRRSKMEAIQTTIEGKSGHREKERITKRGYHRGRSRDIRGLFRGF